MLRYAICNKDDDDDDVDVDDDGSPPNYHFLLKKWPVFFPQTFIKIHL